MCDLWRQQAWSLQVNTVYGVFRLLSTSLCLILVPPLSPSSSVHCSTAPSHSRVRARLCGTCETPPRLELPLCVVVFCLREPSCAMLLLPLRPGPEPSPIVRCHMEVSSNNGDKPVLTLFPDLLRHPAGTKRRNNYYPNYPGRLCLVIVWRGLKGGGGGWVGFWLGGGRIRWGQDPNKRRPQRGWSQAAW